MHSRFLRDFVDRNSSSLPLRSIYKVRTCCGGGVCVQLERSNIIEDNRFRVSELTEANLGLLFGRINNAFVERFETDFKCDSEGVRFLRYLRDRSAELKRLIKVLDVENTVDSDPVAYDYALVDFVACSLKPQQLHGLMCDTEHTTQATLFDHIDEKDMPATIGVIPGLLNVGYNC